MSRSASVLGLWLVLSVCPAVLQPLAAVEAGGGAAAGPQLQARLLWRHPGGYAPVVLTLENPGPPVAVSATARLGKARSIDSWQAPSGVSNRTLLLPPTVGEYGGRGGEVQCVIGELRRARGIGSPLVGDNAGVVLVHPRTEAILDELRQQVNEAYEDTHHYRNYNKTGTAHLQETALLPDRWQAYPSWLSVFLTADALAGLSRDQADALIAWTRTGGHVVLVGAPATLVEDWRAQGARVDVLERDRVDERSAALLRPRRSDRFHNPVTSTVPGTDEVPVTGFMILAVVFSLLVGPANLWWCIRTGRRHMLFVITPVLSLGTCVLLLLYNIFAEGLDIKRLQGQLVVLDQQRHHAVAFTGATYFAPFGIAGMTADAETKILPMNEADQMSYEGRRSGYRDHAAATEALELDWREGQQAGGVWVPSRINRRLVYVQQRPLRDRLVLRRDGEDLQLVNGLPVAVRDLVYCDADGEWWEAGDIEAGAQARLRRSERAALLDEGGEVIQPVDDLGAGARQWWQRTTGREAGSKGWAQAWLAAPLLPVLGPEATDPVPGTHLLLTRLTGPAEDGP